MSKINISPNASGTGTLTITSPNTNTDYTITMPAETGTLFTTGATTGLNASALSTGTVAVARGGTGAATLTANNVVLGNGTSAVLFVAPGTNGNVLTSNGTTWTSAAVPSSAPTTTQVLDATAGLTAGNVGTYAFCGNSSAGTTFSMTFGDTRAGSSLAPYAALGDSIDGVGTSLSRGSTLSGTWRVLGTIGSTGGFNATGYAGSLFVRTV